MQTVDAPSLSVAILPRKAILVGYGTKLTLGRFPQPGQEASPINSIVVDDGQLIRAVAFLQPHSGSHCLVSAGDSKFINVYDMSQWKAGAPRSPATTTEPSTAAVEKMMATTEWKPSYRYGPHAKRITSLATCDDGTILFADKFGEVRRLQLCWSPTHTLEVQGAVDQPCTFLLQHFSIMSSVFLTSPVPRMEAIASTEVRSDLSCRRLFTCDKDCRIRVSCYPETYRIEQYLWPAGSTETSVVTCVAEIPFFEDASNCSSPCGATPTSFSEGNVANPNAKSRHRVPFCYYAMGDESGQLTFWAASNNIPLESSEPVFTSIGTYAPGEGRGAVVSIALIASSFNEVGQRRHARDTPRGVLIAYENTAHAEFIPLLDGIGECGMHPSISTMAHIPLPDRPVALHPCSDATAVALLRSGDVVFLQMHQIDSDGTGGESGFCSFNGNIRVRLTLSQTMQMPFFVTKLKEVIAAAPLGAAGFTELDLFAQWKNEVHDPRARKKGHDWDSGDESGEDEKKEEDDEQVSAAATVEAVKGKTPRKKVKA